MGARSVVDSIGLVPYSKATARLMTRFHEHLLKGNDAAGSLARAGREGLGDSGGYIAAASFICIGG